MKKIILITICLALIAAMITALIVKQKPAMTIDESADTNEIAFYTLGGERISYLEATSPSKTILFLWTSSCDVCKKTLEYLSTKCSLYDDINVLYINIGESKSLVEYFLSRYGITSCISDKTLLDTKANIRSKFFILGVPTVIFFKDGVPIETSYTLNEYLIRKVFGDG